MKKIAVILPYFGKFNNYFELWLDSCKNNIGIDWLIYTDDKTNYQYPDNVKITYTTLAKLRKKIEDKMGYRVSLNEPYKLCDFKPLYGYIFEEDVKDYDFWGWCDCDTIWGDILSVLPDSVWNTYDRVLDKGHLSFIRNNDKINHYICTYNRLKTILTGKAIYAWDEIYDGFYKGMSQLMIEAGYSVFNGCEYIADIDYREKGFRMIEEKNYNSIFHYYDRKLSRIYVDSDLQIHEKDIAYIHLQKRKMENYCVNIQEYYIVPNAFKNEIDEICSKYILDLNCKEQYYFDMEAEINWYKRREIHRILHEPNKFSLLLYILNKRRKRS